jgi:hypothetical protein
MESVFVKATELQEDKDEVLQTLDCLATGQLIKKKFIIETSRYSDLYSDVGRGYIDERCLYEYKKYQNYADLIVGCYFVRIIPKKDCQLSIDYDKGRLSIFMDKKEELVGDFKKDFLTNIVETDKVRIEIEFY